MLNGVVDRIDKYPKKGDEDTPLVFVVKNEEEEIRLEYTGFLPLKKGDLISIGKRKPAERGKRFIIKDKPLVYISTKPEDIPRHLRDALLDRRTSLSKYYSSKSKKKYSLDIGQKVYEEMLQKLGDHEKVIEALNVWAVEFYVTITEKERDTIYSWWKKNVLRRQLYLLGLYNKEIDESGMREDVLFKQIMTNPMTVSSLSMDKVEEINHLIGRETTENDKACGEILRKIIYYKKKKGWFFVTDRVLRKEFPNINRFTGTLFDDYDIRFENGKFYSKENYATETYTTERINDMIKLNKMGQEMREKMPRLKRSPFRIHGDIKLTDEQEEALGGALKNTVSVITGGAGCGKTTLMKQIVRNLEERGRKFLLTSFTGKAVMRIKEIVADEGKKYDENCITISRIIHRRKTFQKVPEFDTLIIDEASMVSTDLFHTFLTLFTNPFSLILIGDCNQLDPIESGSLLKEIIESEAVPIYRLTINKRTEGGTVIVKNANGLIGDRDFGKPYRFMTGNGFYTVDGEVDMVKKIVKGLYKSGVDDKSITILTPVNRYIPILVSYHQKYFLRDKVKMRFKGKVYHYGDRMMQKKNYYSDDLDIMNGEEGYVSDINEDFLQITYRDDKVVGYKWTSSSVKSKDEEDTYSGDELTVDSITNSFAKSIHKSQGSEYDYVIIYIPPENFSFVSINMLYTAITRAKKKVWVVSNLSTLDIITTQVLPKRYETLGERLSNC